MTINPGSELPKVPDIEPIVTAEKMTTGIEVGLNQLLPRMDGELVTNIQPIEAKIVPIKHQRTYPYVRSVLSQTPRVSKIPPIEHPIFIPNLSRIQFTGNASIGFRIEMRRTLRVTTTGYMSKFLLTMVLRLENV